MSWIDIIIERKHELRSMNRERKFGDIIGIALALILIVICVYFYNWWSYRGPTEIDYSRLNEYETEYAHSLMSQIDNEFILSSREIIFTRNLSDIDCFPEPGQFGVCIGINWVAFKKITVFLTMDEEEDSNTIRHEILHNLILNKYDETLIPKIVEKGAGLN